MKKICLLSLILFSMLSGFSQEITRRRVVYAELLGSAVIGSVNYDFRFKPGNDGLGMRMGFSYLPDVLIFPIGVNGLVGKKRFAFEYGAGITVAVYLDDVNHGSAFLTDFKDIGYIAFAKAGLRITPKNKGLFFNLNWTPLFNRDETQWTWFGLGIGYSWNE